MPREATISQGDVSKVADELLAEGRKPSARLIRELLGRGSMATVLRLFQAWQATQAPATPIADIPDTVRAALTEFVASERASACAALNHELSDAQRTLNVLLTENEALRLEVDDLKLANENLREEQMRLEERLRGLGEELGAARAIAEQRRKESAETQAAAAGLSAEVAVLRGVAAELGVLRQELEQERAARVRAEQSAAVAVGKMSMAEALIAELRTRASGTSQ